MAKIAANPDILSLVQYLRFFRVRDWVHLLGLPLFGYVFASRAVVFTNSFWLALIPSSLYLAYGYSINECFDSRINGNVEKQGEYSIPFTRAILLSFFIFIVNLIIVLKFSFEMALLVGFGGITGFLYSGQPFRFKGVPFLGLVFNSLCFTPLFLIGYVSVRPLNPGSFLSAVFIFILFLPVDLIHQLNDMAQDRIAGFKTTALTLGVKKTIGLIAISLIILNLWLMFIYRYIRISPVTFFVTLFFSLYVICYLIIRLYKYGRDIGKYGIKLRFRYIFIVYGIALFVSVWFFY